MTWRYLAGCKYHTQDGGEYCGPAVAMMILSWLGVEAHNLDQGALFVEIQRANRLGGGWRTGPWGLASVLRERSGKGFDAYIKDSVRAGTYSIVRTLEATGAPVAALVFGAKHWVVITGAETSASPRSDPSCTIKGLWVNNPINNALSPHRANDRCGAGDSLGVEDDWVPYSEWEERYFTGTTRASSGAERQFIFVRTTEPVNAALAPFGVKSPFMRPVPAAPKGLNLVGTPLSSRLEDAGSDTGVGLVERLEEPDKPGALYPTPEEALEKILERPLQIHENGGVRVIEVNAGEVHLSTELVWEPCRESWSPHMPFRMLHVGEETFYLRVDGEAFAALTTGLGG